MKASVQKYVLKLRLALLLKAVPLEVNVFTSQCPLYAITDRVWTTSTLEVCNVIYWSISTLSSSGTVLFFREWALWIFLPSIDALQSVWTAGVTTRKSWTISLSPCLEEGVTVFVWTFILRTGTKSISKSCHISNIGPVRIPGWKRL